MSATRISYCTSSARNVAACAVNAFLETGAACIGGGVTLNTRNISCFDLIPAGCLRRLDSLFAAACRCILLADADERNLLRCIKVRVDCKMGISVPLTSVVAISPCSGAIIIASYLLACRSVSIMFCCSS